jgi:hypothetical protein
MTKYKSIEVDDKLWAEFKKVVFQRNSTIKQTMIRMIKVEIRRGSGSSRPPTNIEIRKQILECIDPGLRGTFKQFFQYVNSENPLPKRKIYEVLGELVDLGILEHELDGHFKGYRRVQK